MEFRYRGAAGSLKASTDNVISVHRKTVPDPYSDAATATFHGGSPPRPSESSYTMSENSNTKGVDSPTRVLLIDQNHPIRLQLLFDLRVYFLLLPGYLELISCPHFRNYVWSRNTLGNRDSDKCDRQSFG